MSHLGKFRVARVQRAHPSSIFASTSLLRASNVHVDTFPTLWRYAHRHSTSNSTLSGENAQKKGRSGIRLRAADYTSTQTSTIEANSELPKRPRGRPRGSFKVNKITADDTNTPKRPRGRPPGSTKANSVAKSGKSTITTTTNNTPQEIYLIFIERELHSHSGGSGADDDKEDVEVIDSKVKGAYTIPERANAAINEFLKQEGDVEFGGSEEDPIDRATDSMGLFRFSLETGQEDDRGGALLLCAVVRRQEVDVFPSLTTSETAEEGADD
jgi:hypothetical protein